ncbi:hypothetical protein I6I97_12235 [Sphingobacterium multivorum]|uniref:hypothetical protein n=1 Tax=Sphingobacterium multivorum TaxID=28454 RepID=UPI0019193DEE|nr:hypothetical protein [Sphingobacterium multivorum]QQT60036.1 hypothetical protein I6I97_12235 [Sphingobacterium multivorum]
MKKILSILFIASLFSCEGTTSKKDTAPKDTLSNKDTVAQVQYDSAQMKVVYDKVFFGITKKEYDKLMPNTFNNIGDNSYLFYPMFDDDGKLYVLDISTVSVNANEIDSRLYDAKNNLFKVISKKYGPATQSLSEFNILASKPGYTQWQYEWKIGTKTIIIGIKESTLGSKYSAVMQIYDQPTVDRINDKSNGQLQDNINKDSEKF